MPESLQFRWRRPFRMGVDAADYNNDGWQDLFVANFNRESSPSTATATTLPLPTTRSHRNCHGHPHVRMGRQVLRF